jgi:Flp pilus assembly protein TadD
VTRWAVLGLLPALVAGCTAPLPASSTRITPEQLLEGRPLTGGVEPAPLPDVAILALDDDMRRFVAERMPATGSDSWRLRQLLRGLLDDERFAIEYQERTYTAAEAFHLRRANCLAFTNLFVALARAAGLRVHFQEVDVPPDWSLAGGLLVQNRHMNTLVDVGPRSEQIVDFNMADFRTSYERRVISDERARAHYYSNVAAERLEAGELVPALQNFRKALAADSGFVPAWINLGSLYQRAGQPAWAEAAWLHALDLAPREFVAMSNLERLFRATGRPAEAEEFRSRLYRHRQQNPYYRYEQARVAFASQDYPAAIGHLRFAIDRKANEDRFYALLGLAYLRGGDAASGERWMARAEELAGDESLKQAYHSKLERLRRDQVTNGRGGS